MSWWLIFLTGLTTGGLTCLAMQGGLLASVIANQKESELEKEASSKSPDSARFLDQLDWLPVGLFLVSKLVSHTLLGFFLGWIGSSIELSLTVRLFFQMLAALFMLATAANLLDVHPIFRFVVLQPPKFIHRWIKNSAKSRALFTPAVLGLMTIFIPCGVTQAMEVLALTSGSPLAGALILFWFVLGTSPLFALLGVATAKLSETFHQHFLKLAAVILIFLGLQNLNGVLVVLDAPFTFQKIVRPVTYFFSGERFENTDQEIGEQADLQSVLIQVKDNGYAPNKIKVKVGIPVELTLQTNNIYSCASSFMLKAFQIRLQLGPNDSQTVRFTPTQKGKYPFSCSMGMYSGVLEVI
jgi:uncharacterized protein